MPEGRAQARLERRRRARASGAQGQTGANGQAGANGQTGTKGDQGQAGAPNTGEAALETKIVNLNLKIASLESILNGVTNTELTETIAGLPLLETDLSDLDTTVSGLGTTVSGLTSDVTGLGSNVTGLTSNVKGVQDILKDVTNTELTGAVKSVPQVAALCSQAKTLTTQSNLLGTALGGLSLNGALTIIGGLLNIPVLPASLPAFTCPA